MLIVTPEEARPGMTLAAPVSHPEHPEQDLLKRGYVLEEPILSRLNDIGVQVIYIDYPSLDELDKHLAPYLNPARQKLYGQMKQTITSNQTLTKPSVQYRDYYAGIKSLIETLLTQGQHPLYLDLMSRLGAGAIGHATAVAHLALLLGMTLEEYLIAERKRLTPAQARDVVNLGVAAMLHDIGKLQLPKHLQHHSDIDPPADVEDRKVYETHARIGYEMIHDGVEPTAASAVLQHHQHFDGTGFPEVVFTDGTRSRMDGTRIHVFARIISAANLYDRISIDENAKKRPNAYILHLLRTKYAGWVDPVLIKALHKVAPPFPPGVRVKLSDNTNAIVTQGNAADPFRPTVKRVDDNDLTKLSEPIALSTPGAPTIQFCNGVDVRSYLPA